MREPFRCIDQPLDIVRRAVIVRWQLFEIMLCCHHGQGLAEQLVCLRHGLRNLQQHRQVERHQPVRAGALANVPDQAQRGQGLRHDPIAHAHRQEAFQRVHVRIEARLVHHHGRLRAALVTGFHHQGCYSYKGRSAQDHIAARKFNH